MAKVINDVNHNSVLEEKIKAFGKAVEEFNNSEEAKSLGIWLDLETLYHVVHGHLRKGKITGCHSAELNDCCFEFIETGCTSNGVRKGIVRMKDPELRKFIDEKFSSIFSSEWDDIKILNEMQNAFKENRVLQNYIKKNKIDRVIEIEFKTGLKIEILVDVKSGHIKSYYPSHNNL